MFVRIGTVGLALAALSAFVFLLSPFGESEAVSPTDELLNDRAGDTYPGITQSETSIAAVGDTVVVGWNDTGENPTNCSGQGYARSFDSGATWADRGFIPPGPSLSGGVTAANVSSDPVLGSNHLGEFFFAALANEPGGICGASGRSFIGLWRSQDDGLTFQLVIDASPGTAAGNFQDKEEMAIDTSAASPFQGRIYLCWAEIDPVLFQIHIRVSAFDNAVPVPMPVLVPPTKILASASVFTATSEFVQGCAVDVAPDGRVYVAWGRAPLDAVLFPAPKITLNPGDTGSVEIVSSADGGATWSTPVTVGTGLIAGDPSLDCTVPRAGIDFLTPALNGNIREGQIPTLAISPDGQVNLAVTEGVLDAGSGAYLGETKYTRSTDNGATWSPLITIQSDTTNDQFQPRLTVHSDGTIAAIWYDRAHDPGNLRIHVREGVSFDSGSTWQDFQVTDEDFAPPPTNPKFDPNVSKCYMGDYNAIVAHGSWYFVAWGDNRLSTSSYTSGPVPAHPDPDIRFEAQIANDLDGDGQPNSIDDCPTIATFGSWPVPIGDDDCDGFTTADEVSIGTDPTDPCADTLAPNDETDDKWPPDFDDNRVINTTDVFQVLPPVFGTSVPPTSVRRDLFPDGVINTTDVFRVLPPFLGSSCVA